MLRSPLGDPVDRLSRLARASASSPGAPAPRARRSSSICTNDSGSTYGLRRSIEALQHRLAVEQALVVARSSSSSRACGRTRPRSAPRSARAAPRRRTARRSGARCRGRPWRSAISALESSAGEERPVALHLAQQVESVRLARARAARCRARTRRAARCAPASSEKTHGIARRSSIAGVASPRLAGREPSRRREISSTGVDRVEERDEVRVAVDERRGRRRAERSAIRSITLLGRRRPVRARPRRRASGSATSAALAVSSSSRWAISGTAYFAASTSPCSVIFSRPRDRPGRLGEDRDVASGRRRGRPRRRGRGRRSTSRRAARSSSASATWAR